MKSISCIIPVYNEGNILYKQMKHCISCLEKDFEDYELILVDDGSRDSTANVIAKLQEEVDNIVSLSNNINLNMGISVQRGLAVATKEFVTFNAVDLPLEPAEYKRLIQYMIDNKVDYLVIERKKYLGTSGWRKITSSVNRGLTRLLFPGLKRSLRDTNYTQIMKKEHIKNLLPLAKSPIFTWPEMIFRAKLMGLCVKAITVDYNPRVVRKGAFGKPNDIIWGIYDMIRFRMRKWMKKL